MSDDEIITIQACDGKVCVKLNILLQADTTLKEMAQQLIASRSTPSDSTIFLACPVDFVMMLIQFHVTGDLELFSKPCSLFYTEKLWRHWVKYFCVEPVVVPKTLPPPDDIIKYFAQYVNEQIQMDILSVMKNFHLSRWTLLFNSSHSQIRIPFRVLEDNRVNSIDLNDKICLFGDLSTYQVFDPKNTAHVAAYEKLRITDPEINLYFFPKQ